MQNDFSLVVAPIFACSLIGLLWVKLRLPMNAACLSALVSNIGIPCLLLSSLDQPNLTARVLVHTFAAGAVALACFAALGALFLRALKLPLRQYLPSLMLPNTSNLGLPVALFAFGEQGLLYAVAFSALVQIGHFTIGVWLLSGRASWKSIAASPTIWAVAAALFMTVNGLHPSAPLAATAKQLGNMAPPLMLLMLGASLANIRLAQRDPNRAALGGRAAVQRAERRAGHQVRGRDGRTRMPGQLHDVRIAVLDRAAVVRGAEKRRERIA